MKKAIAAVLVVVGFVLIASLVWFGREGTSDAGRPPPWNDWDASAQPLINGLSWVIEVDNGPTFGRTFVRADLVEAVKSASELDRAQLIDRLASLPTSAPRNKLHGMSYASLMGLLATTLESAQPASIEPSFVLFEWWPSGLWASRPERGGPRPVRWARDGDSVIITRDGAHRPTTFLPVRLNLRARWKRDTTPWRVVAERVWGRSNRNFNAFVVRSEDDDREAIVVPGLGQVQEGTTTVRTKRLFGSNVQEDGPPGVLLKRVRLIEVYLPDRDYYWRAGPR